MSEVLAVHPVVEAQIAEAETKATLDEMLDFARGEAARIEMVQRGLIACGARVAPDPGQIRRLVVADALALVIEMFIRHETEARRLFTQLERTRRAA